MFALCLDQAPQKLCKPLVTVCHGRSAYARENSLRSIHLGTPVESRGCPFLSLGCEPCLCQNANFGEASLYGCMSSGGQSIAQNFRADIV
jgi:hypothetical protein